MINLKQAFKVFFLVFMCLNVSPHAAAEVTEDRDILFCEVDGFKLLGDMYMPEGEGPFPGVLFIHGGGFVGGDKAWTGHPYHLRVLATAGYVVFSINYRLIKDGVAFPESIQDTKCGLAWMKANAEKYGIDVNRIGVSGMSAGGYYSAMIAFTPDDPEFQPVVAEFKDADTSVDAAVFFYPPVNLLTMKNGFSNILEMQLMKLHGMKKKKEVKKYEHKYSPINYVNNNTPVFVGYSTHDRLVPASQQYELIEALEKEKAVFEVFESDAEGVEHGFVLNEPDIPDSVEAVKRTIAFLDKYVKNKN